jgi:type I restriction enzyme S subunit
MSDLPDGWDYVAVSQVAKLENGDRSKNYPSKQHRQSSGVPFINAGHLKDGRVSHDAMDYISPERFEMLTNGKVRRGDVLFCLRGSLGKAAIVSDIDQGAIASSLVIVRPGNAISSQYLYYYLRSPLAKVEIARFDNGTAQPNLAARDLGKFPIPLAPANEQERVVAAIEEQFSRLDAGIAALGRARWGSEMTRKSILDALLKDETGEFFPDILLEDILQRGRYGTSTKCSAEGKGFPVLRIPNVQSGRIDLTDLKYAIDTSVDLKGSRVESGDVLIIRTNGSRSLIGRSAVVPHLNSEMAFASYLIQLKMDRSAIEPNYLVSALSAPHMRRKIEDLAATSAGQYNISLDKLRSLRLPLPPLAQQRNALSRADHLLSAIDHMEQDIMSSQTKAELLRSSILSTAFSGKLS